MSHRPTQMDRIELRLSTIRALLWWLVERALREDRRQNEDAAQLNASIGKAEPKPRP